MAETLQSVARTGIVLGGLVGGVLLGWLLFVTIPAQTGASVVAVLLVVAVTVVVARIAGKFAGSLFGGYDVAEVAVEGPISRDGGGGGLPTRPGGTPADDIVEQIDAANDDENADALIVKLNTPGGEVVPSEDIRLAAERFDGPTVAYATDLCASGGYWIASGCDRLYAREGSIVGSIGVIGSRVNASDLADKVGVSYERFAAGEYKDAGTSLKEMSEDEREYLQGIIDGYYDDFVERVAEGRSLDAETVRDTEARVYLGDDALELGLVDDLATREQVEADLASELGVEDVTVREFEPERGLRDRFGMGARRVAFAFGAGIASVLGDDGGVEGFEFELR